MSIENSFNKTFKGGKSFDRNITCHFERNAFEKGGASKSSSYNNSSTPKRTQEQRVNELLASKKHHPKVKG
jgi:molecular chaperone DnaK (HSP70)